MDEPSEMRPVIGIDEVGRGCWAGPLVAAAVLLTPQFDTAGLGDSKKLSRLQRERHADRLEKESQYVGIGWVWAAEIDAVGLTEAVRLAMRRALQVLQTHAGLSAKADGFRGDAASFSGESGSLFKSTDIIIDGNYNFLADIAGTRTMVGADGLVPAVSAASIAAKVARDRYMYDQAAQYPDYGFDKHVGYGTKLHIDALSQYGVTELHRKSYKPIQRFLVAL